MSDTAEQIKVRYSFVDGAHFFTSRDVLAFGLCVAHPDLERAFAEVAIQLKTLLESNHGKIVTVQPMTPFAEFEKWVTSARNPAFKPRVSGELGWQRQAA